MQVVVASSVDEMSRSAAEEFRTVIQRKPSATLGLATGSTPVKTYKQLIQMHKEEGLDFSRVTTFNLDEYYPLEPTHDQSYRYFMNENLFNHVMEPGRAIRIECTHVPDGTAKNVEEACWLYEQRIARADGIDIQILGIGSNGHIAFNEPGSSLASRTRLVVLTESTIKDNARFFARESDVPRYAITMGIGTILEAKQIILLANGANKARAIADTVEGPITVQVPASALQLHPNVKIIVDPEAGAELKRKDYYTHANKLLAELRK